MKAVKLGWNSDLPASEVAFPTCGGSLPSPGCVLHRATEDVLLHVTTPRGKLTESSRGVSQVSFSQGEGGQSNCGRLFQIRSPIRISRAFPTCSSVLTWEGR